MDFENTIHHTDWLLGMLEYMRRVFMVSSVRTVVLTAVPYIFLNVFAFAVLRRLRIQKEMPSHRQTITEIKYYILNFFIFHTMVVVPVFFLQRFGVFEYLFAPFSWTLIGIVFLEMFALFLLNDTYFYWVHRFMHHPRVMKRVHAIHHHSTNPTPVTAYSFHPFESMILSLYVAVAFLVFGVTLGGLHIQSFMGFMLFTTLHNLYIHSGIEFLPAGFTRGRLTGWLVTSVHHNMHHQHSGGNYSLYFTFWDRLCGTTFDDYQTNFEKIRSPVAQAA